MDFIFFGGEMENFTNLYSLSKTLRFELIPQGKTLENIKKSGILEQDNSRADKYEKIKGIIDDYHKFFIEQSFKDKKIDNYLLSQYLELFKIKDKDDNQKKFFKSIQEKLRKNIISFFDKNKLKRLFEKELIKEDLPNFVKEEQDKELIREFDKFTTYFVGFHENRKNMYSDEEKSTSIAYRIINENLPKFINNIFAFEKISNTKVSEHFKEFYKSIEEYLNVNDISDIFKLDYFSNVISQTQIDVYNLVIGGKTLENGTKIKGLNEYINLYNQTQVDKKNKLPLLSILFKQILSDDRNTISFLPEQFENDNDVLNSIKEFYLNTKDSIEKVEKLLLNLKDYDLSKIYINNDICLTDISQQMFNNYSVIVNAIKEDIKNKNPKSKKENEEKYNERIDKIFKNNISFSIKDINDCIKEKDVESYFIELGKKETINLFVELQNNYSAIKDLLEHKKVKSLIQDEKSVEFIKKFLDSIKEIQHFIKPLYIKDNNVIKDISFYGIFEELYLNINKITPLYNKVRNYVTQKPYSVEKIKLNFENSTLLAGWDLNKERDNTSVILRKDGLYYLAVIDVNNRNVFNSKDAEGIGYEKMEYKFFKDLTTMVPKCTTQLKSVKEHFNNSSSDFIIESIVFNTPFKISMEEYDLNNKLYNGSKKFQKNYLKDSNDYQGYKKALTSWINFCLRFLSNYKSTMVYNIDIVKKEDKINSYESVDGFYSEINKNLYTISFRNISKEYIDKLVEEGKIYLFQIYNKDFSKYSKGTPNIHTMYWKALFDEDNLKNVVYKLNGQAEIFYRKGSIEKENIITHKANNPIENKNIDNKKKQSTFEYDIIKDRRYTVDKFQFHVPITLNFKAIDNERINEQVNQYIKANNIKHIIGIDRGERHLLYLSLIDLKGNIIKQFSLNEIINEYNGNLYKTNYRALLEKREKERDLARKSWKTIENIKELKEGYISQVVHKITQLMIEYTAIVVLEDLNFGFMRGRQKVEKQVYQKFEKMLIDKLNYLLDKKKDKNDVGGLLNAYQLTNKFESFQKMGKQNGFLFYIPAWNTSKMDPITGFVNLFDTRYTNIDNTKKFFENFEDIRFNEKKNYFEFIVNDYTKFNAKAEGTKLNWTICSNGDRIKTFRSCSKNNQWVSETVNLTESFIELFSNIDYKTNLKEQIQSQTDKNFFEKLLCLFRLTLQMRNSIVGTETDYLISPVADKTGNFFDSRKGIENLPNNADANGAYNIARKGLWVVEQIKETKDLKKVKLAISNKEWLQFVQNK